jgi:hypothetical protein
MMAVVARTHYIESIAVRRKRSTPVAASCGLIGHECGVNLVGKRSFL